MASPYEGKARAARRRFHFSRASSANTLVRRMGNKSSGAGKESDAGGQASEPDLDDLQEGKQSDGTSAEGGGGKKKGGNRRRQLRNSKVILEEGEQGTRMLLHANERSEIHWKPIDDETGIVYHYHLVE